MLLIMALGGSRSVLDLSFVTPVRSSEMKRSAIDEGTGVGVHLRAMGRSQGRSEI